MKIILTVAALLGGATLFAADKVTYVPHDKVNASLAKSATIVTEPDLLVEGSHRDKAGIVELHDKETDVFHILDGSATFITGGTMVGGKVTAPGQTRGTDLKGGQVHHLTKGDVIVIPAGTPHWFKEVPTTVSYYVVKVLKQ